MEKTLLKNKRASLGITREQGLYIQYRLRLTKTSFADLATETASKRQSVRQVVFGQIHSKKIESAVARRLGYKTWNEMVRHLREEALT